MRGRPSIRTYLISMNMVLLCLLIPALGILFLWKTSQFRDDQLSTNITLMRQGLANRSSSLLHTMALTAEQSIAGSDYNFLQNMVVEVVANDPEILSCLIVNRQSIVVAHNDLSRIGVHLDSDFNEKNAAIFPEHRPATPAKTFFSWPEVSDNQAAGILWTSFPIYLGNDLWGELRCEFSLAALSQTIDETKNEWAEQMRQFSLYFLGALCFFLLIGFLAALVLTRSFVRATQALSEGVQRVAGGDLTREISLLEGGCHEFADLTVSFNTMTERLRESRLQLADYSRSLEEKVSERTRELREAQEIMLQQAHEAGMAEMAVGVLHNIGNAITPAKVGISILLSELANSLLTNQLAEALHPLSRYIDKSCELPVEDKARFRKILGLLPSAIGEEFTRISKELKNIGNKHDHIENIILLQMRYARLVGSADLIDINQMAKDALRMLEDSINNREIEVITNFGQVVPLKAESTKLIQTLLNLIKNGYEAMDGANLPLRRLTLTSGVENGDTVFLSIKDTGCGFSNEQKAHFFTFGYSTKERGSGFGLHSCANYLIANNGSIEAKSLGPGQGAEFIIRLPASLYD